MAGLQHRLQQRVGEVRGARLDARGIDQPLRLQRAGIAPTGIKLDDDAVTGVACGHDAPGLQFQGTCLHQRLEALGHLARDAMAMDIPIAHRMALESPLVGRGQALPKLAHVMPQRIHQRLPRQALGLGVACDRAQCPHPTAQAQRCERLDIDHRHRPLGSMRERKQAMPRHHRDPAAMASRLQSEHHIHHAEPTT